MKTFEQLIQKVIQRLAMVKGTSVQQYAEDRIGQIIQEKFNEFFDDRFWDELTSWRKYTLDGTTGTIIEDVSTHFSRVMDIERICTDNDMSSLFKMHVSMIPSEVTGGTPTYYMPHENKAKVVKIVPFDSTGSIFVRARTKPKDFVPDNIVPFDEDVMVNAACYDYLMSDNDNPTDAQKFYDNYMKRLAKLKGQENSGNFDLEVAAGRTDLFDWSC